LQSILETYQWARALFLCLRFHFLALTNQHHHIMKDWPLWEVFIRSKQGLSHKHVGSLHATDAAMALENARDVYTRRNEGISIWVVESAHIHASTEDTEAFFDPANDKIYRHPTFYDLPDEVKHM
jgi:ring-1,2-phenylacetyl-CoA epoxidase subunit PaaB